MTGSPVKTVLLVGGIVSHKGKVLLLKRLDAKKFLPGYYDFPGGKIDPGEDPNAAILREVKEETGLTVSIVSPYYVWSDTITFEGRQEYIIEIDYVLSVKGDPNVVLSPMEHSAYIWVDKHSIPEKMSENLRSSLLRFFEISEQEH